MKTKKPPAALESAIKKDCLKLLAAKGILAWMENQGGVKATHKGKSRFFRFSGAKGKSDILGILPEPRRIAGEPWERMAGTFLAVETKRPGRKMTPDQEAFRANVNRAGGVALCVTSAAELQEELQKRGW